MSYLCGMKKGYIYAIKNIANDKRYVGSSIKVLTRLRVHLQQLRDKKHPNVKLQRAYDKYGKNSFVTEILEEFDWIDIEQQFKKEQYYMNLYKCYKEGYNLTSNAKFNGSVTSVKTEDQKKEISRKISEIKKGITPNNYSSMIKCRWRAIEELENGIVIDEHVSTAAAGRKLGICYKKIHAVLRGQIKCLVDFPKKEWRYKK